MPKIYSFIYSFSKKIDFFKFSKSLAYDILRKPSPKSPNDEPGTVARNFFSKSSEHINLESKFFLLIFGKT